MSARPQPPARTRTPRDQGRRNIIEATISLLEDQSPDEITVRQIAEASGHHHRMVQAWFGGKIQLFLAVHEELNAEIARELTPPLGRGQVVEHARMTTQLMNWLIAADPSVFDGRVDTPILDRIAEIYVTTYGLEPRRARGMALRTVAGSIASTLFPGPLGITQEDVVELGELEAHLVELLAASDGAAAPPEA